MNYSIEIQSRILKKIILFLLLIPLFLIGQEKKDTLFIKFDKTLLSKAFNSVDNYYFYRIRDTGNNGFVFFIQEEIYSELMPKKTICLNKILNKEEFHFKSPYINQKKIGKLNDWKLENYFNSYIIFLIKKNDFIKVRVAYEIE